MQPLSTVLYSAYERRLVAELRGKPLPRHVGVMLDGNRRWAKERGHGTEAGHQAGADNIAGFLEWCEEAGVEVVTLWLLSTDNLSRPADELDPLLEIITRAVQDLADTGRWRINHVGARSLLPAPVADALRDAEHRTADVTGLVVNVAVGYGGRQEIVDAVRSFLRECAARGEDIEQAAAAVSAEAIEEHLYTRGQPDPDLVIRTSGEQRLSGFMMWQSAHSEFYFCEVYWPAFRRVDFLRALRDYADRHRRFGG